MRITLTLRRDGGDSTDLSVTADATVTVGELARVLGERDPERSTKRVHPTLALASGPLHPGITLVDSRLQRGSEVRVVDAPKEAPDASSGPAAATAVVVSGPMMAGPFRLRSGANTVGRGGVNDVSLDDQAVSKVHARIVVTDAVEVVDLASANGVWLNGSRIERASLRPDDEVLLGRTVIKVVHAGAVLHDPGGRGELFNRSPQLQAHYVGVKHDVPEPPSPPVTQPMSWTPLLAPLLLGPALYAITHQPATLLFLALSPLLLLGGLWERRFQARRAHQAAVRNYQTELDQLRELIRAAETEEREVRRREHPATTTLVESAAVRAPLLWSSRPEAQGYLEMRLGVGETSAQNAVVLPRRASGDARLWQELLDLQRAASTISGVPFVGSLRVAGSVGVAGARDEAAATVRAMLAQLACRHSPAEVVLAAAVSAETVQDWRWLKWLPHTASEHSPLSVDHLAAEPAPVERLIAALEELVTGRAAASANTRPRVPAVVLFVEDSVPADRSRLVALGDLGLAVGVHLLWLAPSVGRLPAVCRHYVELPLGAGGRGSVADVIEGQRVDGVEVEQLPLYAADAMARSLAPLVDAGARVEDQSDLPRSVPLLSIVGSDKARDVNAVLDEWRAAGLVNADVTAPRALQRDFGLRATIGLGPSQGFALDLREHGPHALVGGTTGAGKSEFLRTWVTAMALAHPPERLTFLFVDYKGEAAFGKCVKLPHFVGLVSDLNPHLVRRALMSLRAELRYREEVLRDFKAKDLLELERRGARGIPPSLVIVVDEFAALVKQIPEFVDGVVDVAQRGRSLGLHLVLATQRPAGVVRDNLRANTNLRIALRVADEDDSTDVLGVPDAAAFDPGLPGRAMAKLGPGRVQVFQSAYVGGRTPDVAPPPPIVVVEQPFGTGEEWPAPSGEIQTITDSAHDQHEATDLDRLVGTISTAHKSLQRRPPRRPWLEPLPAPCDLDDLFNEENPYLLEEVPGTRSDSELIFGLQDDPSRQRRLVAAFRPDRDGSIAVFGTGGAGKSAFLRTLALAAAETPDGGPCHVYGLDFGAQGLRMLDHQRRGITPDDGSRPDGREMLPHVGGVVAGDDDERVVRLLRMLRDVVEERAVRYAAVSAGTIVDYRRLAGAPAEPRILLLVDGIGAFRTAYEVGSQARWFEVFQSIVADGRAVGVHVALSADRSTAIPSSLASLVQRRLVLRVAGEGYDDPLLRVPRGAFNEETPPGRGFLDGAEIQVAVPGGSQSTIKQAAAIATMAERPHRDDRYAPPAPIQRLPEQVPLRQLPAEVDGLPTLGVEDLTLSPIGFTPAGTLLVTGPPGSGRTSLLATLALSFRRLHRQCDAYYLGAAQSSLRERLRWNELAEAIEDVGTLAEKLSGRLTEASDNPCIVIVENLPDFVSTPADGKLQTLIKTARRVGHLVVIDGDTSGMTAGYPLIQLVKVGRHGIALQPDQTDGDSVFKTSFPRVNRASFPAGRGFYVRSGQVSRVQCATPEVD